MAKGEGGRIDSVDRIVSGVDAISKHGTETAVLINQLSSLVPSTNLRLPGAPGGQGQENRQPDAAGHHQGHQAHQGGAGALPGQWADVLSLVQTLVRMLSKASKKDAEDEATARLRNRASAVLDDVRVAAAAEATLHRLLQAASSGATGLIGGTPVPVHHISRALPPAAAAAVSAAANASSAAALARRQKVESGLEQAPGHGVDTAELRGLEAAQTATPFLQFSRILASQLQTPALTGSNTASSPRSRSSTAASGGTGDAQDEAEDGKSGAGGKAGKTSIKAGKSAVGKGGDAEPGQPRMDAGAEEERGLAGGKETSQSQDKQNKEGVLSVNLLRDTSEQWVRTQRLLLRLATVASRASAEVIHPRSRLSFPPSSLPSSVPCFPSLPFFFASFPASTSLLRFRPLPLELTLTLPPWQDESGPGDRDGLDILEDDDDDGAEDLGATAVDDDAVSGNGAGAATVVLGDPPTGPGGDERNAYAVGVLRRVERRLAGFCHGDPEDEGRGGLKSGSSTPGSQSSAYGPTAPPSDRPDRGSNNTGAAGPAGGGTGGHTGASAGATVMAVAAPPAPLGPLGVPAPEREAPRDTGAAAPLGPVDQVSWMIQQATSVDNLCVMYEGWAAWV